MSLLVYMYITSDYMTADILQQAKQYYNNDIKDMKYDVQLI